MILGSVYMIAEEESARKVVRPGEEVRKHNLGVARGCKVSMLKFAVGSDVARRKEKGERKAGREVCQVRYVPMLLSIPDARLCESSSALKLLSVVGDMMIAV